MTGLRCTRAPGYERCEEGDRETPPDGQLLEFIQDQVLVFEAGEIDAALAAFPQAIARHRHFARQTDPPQV